MKNKEIVIPILNNEYKVVVCWGDSKFIGKVLKSWWYPELDDLNSRLKEHIGVTFTRRGCHPVIALPKKPHTPKEIGNLAHESIHAIKDIFDYLEEKNGDEVFAYCVGAVVRSSLEVKE